MERVGGIKIEVIEKLVRDPMLLNMIFKANEIKNKSCILKIERVTVIFMSEVGQNLNFLKKIKSQNLTQFSRLGM